MFAWSRISTDPGERDSTLEMFLIIPTYFAEKNRSFYVQGDEYSVLRWRRNATTVVFHSHPKETNAVNDKQS